MFTSDELQHRARQQSRAGEQHHRHGDLRDDERALQTLAPQAAAHRGSRRPRSSAPSAPSFGERRREGEEQRHGERQQQREAEHHPVEADLVGARRVALGERGEQAHAAERDERDRATAPMRGEHEVLDEQEPPQPRVPAPSAARTTSSCSRRTPRMSVRFATLAQEMIITNAAAPMSSQA